MQMVGNGTEREVDQGMDVCSLYQQKKLLKVNAKAQERRQGPNCVMGTKDGRSNRIGLSSIQISSFPGRSSSASLTYENNARVLGTLPYKTTTHLE